MAYFALLDDDVDHVPGDFVLSIDVSSSMGSPAPVPPLDEDDEPEETGMTLLDLTKHAAKTVVRCLDHRDRVSIVQFGTDAEASILLPRLSETVPSLGS